MDSKELKERFANSFRKHAVLDYKVEDWDYVLDNALYVPVEYLKTSLNYQKEYMLCFCDDYIDLSVIIYENSKPICAWPINILKMNEQWRFSTNEKEILPPIFIHGIQDNEKKKIFEDCLSAIENTQEYLNDCGLYIDSWSTKYSLFEPMKMNGNIQWFRRCMENGGESDTICEMYVDLSQSIEAIHGGLRRRYKSFLNKSKDLWNVEIITNVSDDEIEYFRQKHIEVAGRETRSLESWKKQQQSVNQGNGFIIKLKDNNNGFVGESLFEISRDEGLYSVGVYDRTLYEQPVSHMVQWEAIKYMKQIGLKYYKIGQRFYSGKTLNQRVPTDKELSISYFKEGFMSQMDIALIIKNSFKKVDLE